MKKIFAVLSIFLAVFGYLVSSPASAQQSSTETIVLIRHGEKTKQELGQLNIRGLNRSLAIPNVLIGKFGKPNYIFAPNPSVQVNTRSTSPSSYIRPLATIEPTAIQLGMTVNAQIGYDDIKGLQTELSKPIYSNSVIFVAWEHIMEDLFAKNMMTTYANNASIVPDWPDNDFDSIFVIRIVRTAGAAAATFSIDHENLNNKLSDSMPSPAKPAAN
jgi:hypothetical protein